MGASTAFVGGRDLQIRLAVSIAHDAKSLVRVDALKQNRGWFFCNLARPPCMAANLNFLLVVGAGLSATAAALHLGCMVFGARWYRFFGAGEGMAKLALAGSWRPAIITFAIAVMLSAAALYALSGAGLVGGLPFLHPALCMIVGAYLVRGVAGLPFLPFATGRSRSFWWWSSIICLCVGVIHFVGLRQVWAHP